MGQRQGLIEDLILKGYGINRICEELGGLKPLEFYDLSTANSRYNAGLPIARRTRPEIDKLVEEGRSLSEILEGRDARKTLDYIIYSGQYWALPDVKKEEHEKCARRSKYMGKIGLEEEKEIERLISEGLSLAQIAAKIQVRKQAIHQFLKKRGLHEEWLAKRTERYKPEEE